MTKCSIAVFDADGHVLEDEQKMLDYYEGRFEGVTSMPTFSIWPSIDGWPRGIIKRTAKTTRKEFHTDARIWGRMLERLGLEGTVLYPTAGLATGLMNNIEWAHATAVAYNNWLEDRYTRQDERLHAAGLLAVQNPEAAAREIARCRNERTRFVACILPAMTCLMKTYGDAFFAPIFEAAQEHGMPLAIHGGPSRGLGFDHFDEFVKVHTLEHPFPLMIQLTDIIFSGVFDRFPDVQIAFLEGGCTWVPFMMDRLDNEYESIFGIAARRRLRKRPSEYLRSDRFWVSMDLGERGLKYALDAIGASNIFYASDYPHEPTETELRDELSEFVASPNHSDSVKHALLHDNAKRFYGLS